MLTRFLKSMQQVKCKHVITTFHFWKIRYILLFWSVLYILSGTRLQNDIWKTLFINPSFVYIHIRGVHFICVQKECSQYAALLGSQAAQIEDEARECIFLWCCFWTEAWAGAWITGTTEAPEESILWQLAFFPTQGQPWRNRAERVTKLHRLLLAGFKEWFQSRNHSSFLARYWQVTKS